MELLQHTLYINLDHREDRLQHIKIELDKIGITAERFPAVRMKAGNIGCTLSHIRCIELAKKRRWPYVFICEDDITFTDPRQFLTSLSDFEKSNNIWDVIIIGGNNCPPFDQISYSYARVYNIQTTTGYIVHSKYYDVLLNNFKEGLEKLIREPDKKKQYSLDIYWKTLQPSGSWFMITPPTVIQYYDYSDIEEKVVDYGPMMLDLEKKALMEKYNQEFQKMKREQEKKQFFEMGI